VGAQTFLVIRVVPGSSVHAYPVPYGALEGYVTKHVAAEAKGGRANPSEQRCRYPENTARRAPGVIGDACMGSHTGQSYRPTSAVRRGDLTPVAIPCCLLVRSGPASCDTPVCWPVLEYGGPWPVLQASYSRSGGSCVRDILCLTARSARHRH